ncbi:MAG TPA: ethylbenzene dehydrogenase-related protein, partial [Xanthobacteraceae bacterium]|nr:ethylbenzene dehydrogenase-related protein [Xanthobacteraceae bacterium]
MVDVSHARVGGLEPGPTVSTRRAEANASGSDRAHRSPRTDIGTIALHWTTATAFLVSVFTGVRIAADDPGAVISKWLTPVLPQGEVWTWHFYAGLSLFFCAAAYFIYMSRSGLTNRVAWKKVKKLVMPRAGKHRYDALNVLLDWLLYGIVFVLAATGIPLYLGYGGWLVTVHLAAAFTGIAYIFAHVASHYLYGGVQEWLRVFRPAALIITKATRPWPLSIALFVGVAITGAIAGLDWATRDTLTVRRVATAPKLDRLLDDPAWAGIRPARVQTQQGANLGGTGESLVEIRAVHDGKKIYFAFRWEDPSRSMRRNPLIKQADGWHIMGNNPYIDDVTTFYEDKFSVIFSPSAAFGSGGMAHLGDKPVADKPGARNGRGLHYTDGTMIDMWQWKAARGGVFGRIDDQFIGAPKEPTADEASQLARYQGGYWGDPGTPNYVYTFLPQRPGEYHGGPVALRSLPKDYVAINKAMGHWDPSPDASVDDGSKWWMF